MSVYIWNTKQGCFRPVVSFTEVKRGKNKGKIKAILPDGKKIIEPKTNLSTVLKG